MSGVDLFCTTTKLKFKDTGYPIELFMRAVIDAMFSQFLQQTDFVQDNVVNKAEFASEIVKTTIKHLSELSLKSVIKSNTIDMWLLSIRDIVNKHKVAQ